MIAVALLALNLQGCAGSLDRLRALDGHAHDDSVAALAQTRAATDPCHALIAATLAGLLSSPADSTWRDRLTIDQELDAAWRNWANDPHLLLATAVLRYRQGSRMDAGRAAHRALDMRALTPHERAVTLHLLGSIAQDEWRDWRSFGDLAVATAGQWHCSSQDPNNAAANSGSMTGMSIAAFNIMCPVTFEEIMDRSFHLNADLNKDNRAQLEEFFRQAIASDPAYWPSIQALAGELVFEKNWDALRSLAAAARRSLPADYRPRVLLALADYRSASGLDAAAGSFDSARVRMPPYVRGVYDDIGRVVTPAESAGYFGTIGAVQRELKEEYWRAHQGVFLEKTNDRLIEHYARVTEAGFLFAEPTTGRTGWDSDAGRIWIRYGRPLKIRDLAMETGRASFWSYGPDPDFVFQRNLRYFVYRTQEDAAGMVQEMAEHHPAKFKPPTVDSVLPLARQVVRFWVPRDSSHELVVLAPYPETGRRGDLRLGVTLLDSAFRRAASWTGTPGHGGGLVAALSLKPTGPFRLVVEQLDPVRRRLEQSRDTLTISTPDDLALSDILMAKHIDGQTSATGWRQLGIDHSFGATVEAGGAFALYWEVYHPALDSAGVARYAVNIEVRTGSRPLLARIISGITRQTPQPETSLRFDHVAPAPDGRVPNWVNVQAALQPGRYQVTVTVTDKASGRSTTARRDFEVR